MAGETQQIATRTDARHARWAAVLVGLAAAAIYLPSLRSGFVNLDDPQYVARNPYVLNPSFDTLRAVFAEI
ncbi:MAG: hypothetical protein V3T70_03025, partial [Phycisphaerae bacterium]